MHSMAAISLLAMALSYAAGAVVPKLKPFVPFRPTVQYPGLIGQKHNWCYLNFTHGTRLALSGRTVSVLMQIQNRPNLLLNYDNATGIVRGGIMPAILDEAARRGNFTWRPTAIVNNNPLVGTGHHWMRQTTSSFDIAMDWFAITPWRANNLNVRFGYPFLNLDMKLVTKFTLVQDSLTTQLMKPFKPFHWTVWVCIGLFFVLGGIAYYLTEQKGADFDGEHWTKGFFFTTGSFFGSAGFSPGTKTGRVFVLSWSIWVLILTSAYTANLATILLRSVRSSAEVSSIEDAINRNMRVCAHEHWFSEPYLKKRYPKLDVAWVSTDNEFFTKINSGYCAAGVGYKDLWPWQKVQEWVDPICDLETTQTIGHMDYRASWVYGLQVSTCDDMLADVLNSLMFEMHDDGYVDSVKESTIKDMTTTQCAMTNNKDRASSTLNILDVFGAFLLPMVGTVIGVVASINKKNEEKTAESTAYAPVQGTELVGTELVSGSKTLSS